MTPHSFTLSTTQHYLFNILHAFIRFRIVENEIFLLSYCLLIPSALERQEDGETKFLSELSTLVVRERLVCECMLVLTQSRGSNRVSHLLVHPWLLFSVLKRATDSVSGKC
jgi:hypothetical protein